MRLWPIAVLAAIALLLSGCKVGFDPDSDSGSGEGGGTAQEQISKSKKPGCRTAGPLSQPMLPTVDSSEIATIDNPCLGLVKLAAQVIGPLAEADRDELRAKGFIGKLDTFAARLDKLTDVQECAYQTDSLAIRLYRDRAHPKSIGAVVVIRSELGATVDMAGCYLLKQIPFLSDAAGDRLLDERSMRIEPCFTIIRADHGGRSFTVMWLGSTDVMCGVFAGRYLPYVSDSDSMVQVNADPSVAVRADPSRTNAPLIRLPFGTLGEVICHVEGEPVQTSQGTSTIWTKTHINGIDGYIAHGYLTGDDLSQDMDANGVLTTSC